MTPMRLAWLLTGVAVGLAVWPGLESLWSSQSATYDTRLAVLTATLVAIIWYTHFTYKSVEASRRAAESTRRLAELQESGREARGRRLAYSLFWHVLELGAYAVIWRSYDEEEHERISEQIEEGQLAFTRHEDTRRALDSLEEEIPEMMEVATTGYPGVVDALGSLRHDVGNTRFGIPEPDKNYARFEEQMKRFREGLSKIVRTLEGALEAVSTEHCNVAREHIRRLNAALEQEES